MLPRKELLAFLVLLGCTPTRGTDLSQTVFPPGAVREAFRADHGWRHSWARERDDQGDWWFEHRKAESRILVLAAHTEVEWGTAGLACVLASWCPVNAVYGVRRAPSYPFQKGGGAFETALNGLIDEIQPVLIVDLRALRGVHRAADVDIGTGKGRWLRGRQTVSDLAQSLTAQRLYVTRDAHVPGKGYAERLSRKAPYVRLTINPSRLPVLTDSNQDPTWRLGTGSGAAQAQRFAQLMQGLVRGLRSLDRQSRANR
ncbi:MAG: hypothetical protein ACYS0K_13210 [Planctomycetota bacterium]|jgi:hypothetical protein